MAQFGLTVKHDTGAKRVELQCEHQNGVLYVVPSDKSWVCDESLLHAHALSGFLGELSRLEDPKIKDAMQRWGLYFRQRPLEGAPGAGS